MRGVPLTIHTINLTNILSGLNLDVEPKEIISPRGMAPINVTINNFKVCRNPVFNALKTTGNCSRNKSIVVLSFNILIKGKNREWH